MSDHQWEYRVESIGEFFRSFNIEQRLDRLLNRRGREGWELVSTQRTWLTNRYTLQFRRPVRPVTTGLRVA